MISRKSETCGIIIIDKPPQWTSHDVVAKLRGILKQKRIGHGGTLDPMATGVLPVFAGKATKAAEYIENADKEYIAGLRFGIITDTQDITGRVLDRCDCFAGKDGHNISAEIGREALIEKLESVLPSFTGKQKQVPPMYSAVKQNGKKLYELARKGIEVERPARMIEISAIELVAPPVPECDADIFIKVRCSKGTYIRTLCHDIGILTGCGAVMSYLRRTKAGIFDIDNAHTLESLTSMQMSEYLLPVDNVFSDYPELVLGEADTRKVKNGIRIALPGMNDGRYRVYSFDNEFILLGEVCSGRLHILKSFYNN